MKSNSKNNPAPFAKDQDTTLIRAALHREKENLLSMFLANASRIELEKQYKVIDRLAARLNQQEGRLPSS